MGSMRTSLVVWPSRMKWALRFEVRTVRFGEYTEVGLLLDPVLMARKPEIVLHIEITAFGYQKAIS